MIPNFDLTGFITLDSISDERSVLFVDEEAAQAERERKLRDALIERELELSEEEQRERDAQAEEDASFEFRLTDFDLLQPIDEWIEENCYDWEKVNQTTLDVRGAPKIKLTDKQRRILRHIFKPTGNSISKYRRVIWSEPKKEGKTTIASCVVAYFAACIDPPNNILCIANKKDQAEGRIYRSAKATLKALGGNVPTATNSKPVITLPNGTKVQALPNSPATEAGDSYSLTAWSEIWAFKSEDDERLFAELMPVPTRRVSMQWVETYAGYWDESNTLKRLYLKAWTDQTEKTLAEGAQYVPELLDITTDNRPACVEIPGERIFIYWSHENSARWKDEDYIRVEEKSLTKVEAVRLLQNRWQASSSDMLEPFWITRSFADEEIEPYLGKPFVLAVDAAEKWDNIALVGTIKSGEIYYTVFCEIFEPKGQDADLNKLVRDRVSQLFKDGQLASYYDEEEERWITPVYFDPTQLHQIRLDLIEEGIDVIKFNQGADRQKADTLFYKTYKNGDIRNPKRPDLEEHLLGAKAKYKEGEQVRIEKGTTKDAKKIDAAVAQSMSLYGSFLMAEKLLTSQDDLSVLSQGSTENSWFNE